MKRPEERRDAILELLRGADLTTASDLAEKLGVSRQIIVTDIAILRERGCDITSTSRGYALGGTSKFGYVDKIQCRHTADDIVREFDIIVDEGGTVLDISIIHPVYGILTAAMYIHTRREAREFIRDMENLNGKPLSLLTEGAHLHTVGCRDREVFEEIVEKLRDCGIYEEI